MQHRKAISGISAGGGNAARRTQDLALRSGEGSSPPRPTTSALRASGVATLAHVVDFLESVYRRRDCFHARLELKGQIQRVVSRLVQVAAVKPKRLLLGGFPHVAQLPLPRSGILCGA